MTRTKKLIVGFSVVIVLVLVLHAFLPRIILKYVNRVLNRLPEYSGSVADIDISLIRGAYLIKGFDLKKKSGNIKQPFISIPVSDLSIEWRAIFQGKLVGEIELETPQMNIVNSDSEAGSQLETKGDWQGMVADLMPVKINRFAINKGQLTYRHEGTQADKSLEVTGIDASLTNLSNKPEKNNPLPSELVFKGMFQRYAPLNLKGRINPLAKNPTFDVNLQIDTIPLVKLDSFLIPALGIDAEEGTFQLYGEVSCRNSDFTGYVKPILREVRILSLKNDSSNPLELVWESIMALVIEVFSNQRHDQFAAKIPLEGKLDDPKAGIFTALRSIISNAYVRALKADFDNEVVLEKSKK